MSLSEAMLLDDVRRRMFSPTRNPNPHAIGLELELIPIFRSSRAPALATKSERGSTADVLSRLGQRGDWRERSIGGDPPSWTLPDGGSISFEPGGQIEISTAPRATASAVIGSTQRLVTMLRDAMANDGIELVARGVDPYNDIASVPLQLHRDRYTGMTRYFESIGPSGVRMMRQTAALQINLERGEDPRFRWRLLNALAPIVVALFANSRQYAGRSTEWASYRAYLWRTLDRSRTGVIYEEPAYIEKYLSFALDAVAMHSAGSAGPYRTFREWMHEANVDESEWLFHLSTLFPEVRPKEYFELRSADTIEPHLLAAPIVFVTGLVYDQESAARATDLLGAPSETMLERAGRLGLSDPEIRRIAATSTELALSGARRLGKDYISLAHLETARAYFAQALTRDDS